MQNFPTKSTTANRTIKEAMRKSNLNKKRRIKAARKKKEIIENAKVLKLEDDPNIKNRRTIKEEVPLHNLLRKIPNPYRPIDYIAEKIAILKKERNLQELHKISSKGFARAVGKISNDFYCDRKLEETPMEQEKILATEKHIDFSNVFGINNNSSIGNSGNYAVHRDDRKNVVV